MTTTLDHYHYQASIDTRWHDNDIYGHVNNVVYYSYFDSTINRYLINHAGLDIHQGDVIGFVVSSQCEFHAPVAYPACLIVGLGVIRLGRSSVTYQLGLFDADGAHKATGQVVHVFVDRATQKACEMPALLRSGLEKLKL